MENLEKGIFNAEFLRRWHSNFNRLESFSRQRTPNLHEPDEELEQWVTIQRRIRHMLPRELKDRLTKIEFDFGPKEASWEGRYRQLARFVKVNGHPFLPDHQKYGELKDWLLRQILAKKLLSSSQVQKLDNLGIDWNLPISRDYQWEQMYARLEGFRKAFGHCRVPQSWENDRQLANWVAVQRRNHGKGMLREDRQRKLNDLGFVWHIKTEYDSQWEQHFRELSTFRKNHGHCRVPGSYAKLASWIERQRTSNTNNSLPADRKKRLTELGLVWSFREIKEEKWEEKFRQLCLYKEKHGHCFVPVNHRQNAALGIWVATQRGLEAKGKLQEAKRERLDSLGFVWRQNTQHQMKSNYDSLWNHQFERLRLYWQRHGTCQVSVQADPVLQRWTRTQRIQFNEGTLPEDRIQKLNSLGFPWSVQESYWSKMYDALSEFRHRFGHTRVPFRWEPSPTLAAWVYRMRANKQELTTHQIALLDRIGFDWSLTPKNAVPWTEMYNRLLQFRQEHGHPRVPVKWAEDPKLGKWVSRMRQEWEKLDPERRNMLEAAGFLRKNIMITK